MLYILIAAVSKIQITKQTRSSRKKSRNQEESDSDYDEVADEKEEDSDDDESEDTEITPIQPRTSKLQRSTSEPRKPGAMRSVTINLDDTVLEPESSKPTKAKKNNSSKAEPHTVTMEDLIWARHILAHSNGEYTQTTAKEKNPLGRPPGSTNKKKPSSTESPPLKMVFGLIYDLDPRDPNFAKIHGKPGFMEASYWSPTEIARVIIFKNKIRCVNQIH